VDAAGSKVSKRRAQRLEDYIIRSSLDLRRPSVSPGSELILEQGTTTSQPDQAMPTPTCGKMKHQLPALDSNLDESFFEETLQSIGMRYWLMQRREILEKFPLTYKFAIIGHSEQLLQTITDQLASKKQLMCFMDEPVLEKVGELGRKPVFSLILKIHGANGGTGTKVKKMLLSMNSEELLTFPTYSDGWIGTLSVWNVKDQACPYKLPRSGSLVIWLQELGILN